MKILSHAREIGASRNLITLPKRLYHDLWDKCPGWELEMSKLFFNILRIHDPFAMKTVGKTVRKNGRMNKMT